MNKGGGVVRDSSPETEDERDRTRLCGPLIALVTFKCEWKWEKKIVFFMKLKIENEHSKRQDKTRQSEG